MKPRNFPYKTLFKRRCYMAARHQFKLFFGQYGILLKTRFYYTSNHVNKFKLLLKRNTKKATFTKKKFWLNIFPYIPVTRKNLGARMGKGKGKLKLWGGTLPANKNLFEIRNLRYGRILKLYRKFIVRLPIQTKLIGSQPHYPLVSIIKVPKPVRLLRYF